MSLSDADMIDFRDEAQCELRLDDPAPLEPGARRIIGFFGGVPICWFDWAGEQRGPVVIVAGSRGERIAPMAIEHAAIGFCQLSRAQEDTVR